MVNEENIDFLRHRKARYIVGTPKKQLKRFEASLVDQSDWTEVQSGLRVKLVEHPDGQEAEQFVFCRSQERQKRNGDVGAQAQAAHG